jgi:ABC-type nitrate/sulfonate/bicarbonate transport system substrate-binding protein
MAGLSRLRLIQFRAAYNLPVQAALENGIFAKHSLDVEVAYTPGSDFLIAALEAGKFEIGHTAADDVVAAVELQARQGGARSDLFLFMGLHSGLLSLVAGLNYPDVESLRGQGLGVDSKTTGFVFLLQKFLRANGLEPGDYALIEIGGWEQRCRALLGEKIAATLLTAPYVYDAVRGGCHVLARGKEIIPVYQATCGAARRSWAKANASSLVEYIRAYVEATAWCFAPANRHACRVLLKQLMGLDNNSAEQALAELLNLQDGLYPDAALHLPGLAAVLALRAEMGRLELPVPPGQKYLDLSFYQKACAR